MTPPAPLCRSGGRSSCRPVCSSACRPASWLVLASVVLLTGCSSAAGVVPSPAPGGVTPVAPSRPARSASTPAGPAAAGGDATTAGSCAAHDGLPDARCTPGEADPRVTPATLRRTICRSGYAGSVRPPLSVTHPLKVRLAAAYGLGGVPFSRIELDHLVPLSLGGASTARNLWPELRTGPAGASAKDVVEVRLHREVCAGQIGLREAQRAIATDWRTAP